MIHRMDPPEDPDVRADAGAHRADARPQRDSCRRARSSSASRSSGTASGRSLFCDHGHVELRRAATARDFTPRYPEVRELARALGARRIVLDGEVVAFDEEGRPSFERLQSRMHLASDSAVRRRMRDIPATYVIFDLLYLDGHSTMAPAVRGAARAARAARAGGAGVAHARLPPRRGAARCSRPRRSSASRASWPRSSTARTARRARLALDQGQERPHPGRGDRRLDAGRGRAQREPRLARRRRDGGRGARRTRARSAPASPSRRSRSLKRELEPLRRDTSPFSGRQPPKGTIFVEPRLVAHVEFREWTRSGTLRAPSFKGLRPDVSPQECVREEGQEAPAG